MPSRSRRHPLHPTSDGASLLLRLVVCRRVGSPEIKRRLELTGNSKAKTKNEQPGWPSARRRRRGPPTNGKPRPFSTRQEDASTPRGRQQAPACGKYISLWSARPTCQAGRAHARTNRPRFPSTCPGVTGERFRPRSRSHATGNRRTAGIFSFFSLSLSLSFFFWAHADAVTQQGRVTG